MNNAQRKALARLASEISVRAAEEDAHVHLHTRGRQASRPDTDIDALVREITGKPDLIRGVLLGYRAALRGAIDARIEEVQANAELLDLIADALAALACDGEAAQ